MKCFDVFNGDADGIFSLLQLRSENPLRRELVTGVKRDINLLKNISGEIIDSVTVLDISMEKNIEALVSILSAGANVFYVDHHYSGDIPSSKYLDAIINTDANVCTSSLVNEYLEAKHILWAVAGVFGDNLDATAMRLADHAGVKGDDLELIRKLGIYVNYNGYGSNIEDLYFHPKDLYSALLDSGNPFEFVHCSAIFKDLENGYQEDFTNVESLKPFESSEDIAVYVLPCMPWARRVSGVFANNLANQYPNRGHAILTKNVDGSYLVSVRAPLSNKCGAVDVCRKFQGGGGREAAAGINFLPEKSIPEFISALTNQYSH